jgi:hypothetical protein
LVGRPHERQALNRTLDVIRARERSTLVLAGDRGIDKTAVLDYLRDRATGCDGGHRVCRPRRAGVTFAGLHQLCAPLLDRLEPLPAPRAQQARPELDQGPHGRDAQTERAGLVPSRTTPRPVF